MLEDSSKKQGGLVSCLLNRTGGIIRPKEQTYDRLAGIRVESLPEGMAASRRLAGQVQITGNDIPGRYEY